MRQPWKTGLHSGPVDWMLGIISRALSLFPSFPEYAGKCENGVCPKLFQLFRVVSFYFFLENYGDTIRSRATSFALLGSRLLEGAFAKIVTVTGTVGIDVWSDFRLWIIFPATTVLETLYTVIVTPPPLIEPISQPPAVQKTISFLLQSALFWHTPSSIKTRVVSAM